MARAASDRLDETVYEETKVSAWRRGPSMNALIETAFRNEMATEHEQELYNAASLLGRRSDSDVDYAFAAQAEIVLKA